MRSYFDSVEKEQVWEFQQIVNGRNQITVQTASFQSKYLEIPHITKKLFFLFLSPPFLLLSLDPPLSFRSHPHWTRDANKWSQVPFCCLLHHALLCACSVGRTVAFNEVFGSYFASLLASRPVWMRPQQLLLCCQIERHLSYLLWEDNNKKRST